MDNIDIRELATAAWRLEKWLDNLNAERKMAAKSSLRNIKKYISACNVEIKDPLGSKFDPGLAVEVVNNESPEIPEEELIIIETLAPYVYQDGELIQYARVIVGTEIRAAKANNEIKTEKSNVPETEEPPKKQSSNDLWVKEEIDKLNALIADKPNKKTKTAICAFCVVLVALLLTNIVMISLYKHSLSKDIANNYTHSNSEEITTIKASISEIEKAISVNSDKLDELLKKYNDSLKSEVKLQSYTVQEGDTLSAICETKEIDYNKNLKLIQSINGLEDPSKIYVGQVIVLPITDTEE